VKSFRAPAKGSTQSWASCQGNRVAVLTDVHEAGTGGGCRTVDYCRFGLSLPADDLLVAAARRPAVNVKKGQFVAPWDMQHTVRRCVPRERTCFLTSALELRYNTL